MIASPSLAPQTDTNPLSLFLSAGEEWNAVGVGRAAAADGWVDAHCDGPDTGRGGDVVIQFGPYLKKKAKHFY